MQISKTELRAKNLNLLVLFDALYETLSVSEASKRLRMSQPNLSRALRVLRGEFGDPLFVRNSRGVAPTRRATELAPRIREALRHVGTVYDPATFDPARATGRFTIATTDYVEFLLAPSLVSVMSREAPRLTLNFRPSEGVLPKRALERGDYDLSVIVLRESVPGSYFKQTLFHDPYVCAVRKGHPILGRRKSIEHFVSFGHAIISPQGTLWGITDDRLKKLGQPRHIALGTPNALTTVVAVAKSDLILTATRRFIEGMRDLLPLETFESPIPMAPIEIAQLWHERSQNDPLHQWVRQRIRSLLS